MGLESLHERQDQGLFSFSSGLQTERGCNTATAHPEGYWLIRTPSSHSHLLQEWLASPLKRIYPYLVAVNFLHSKTRAQRRPAQDCREADYIFRCLHWSDTTIWYDDCWKYSQQGISYRLFDCLVVVRGCFVGWFCLLCWKSFSHFSGITVCLFFHKVYPFLGISRLYSHMIG